MKNTGNNSAKDKEKRTYDAHRFLIRHVLRGLYYQYGEQGITLSQLREACEKIPLLAAIPEGYKQLIIRDVWKNYRRYVSQSMRGGPAPARVSRPIDETKGAGVGVRKYAFEYAPLEAVKAHRQLQKAASDAASVAASVSEQWIEGTIEDEDEENGQD